MSDRFETSAPTISVNVRSAVDEVAEEHRGAAGRMHRVDGPAQLVALQPPAEALEQGHELVEAAVHVADHVEGPRLAPQVVEERFAADRRGRDLVDAVQHVHPPEALLAERPERAPQLVRLPAHDVGAEVAVRPLGGAGDADLLGHVEDDRDGEHVVVAGEADHRAARVGLDVRRVDHRQQAGVQALAGDEGEGLECARGGRLVVLVVRDEPAEHVARERLERRERGARERGLAGSARPDQDDEREVRDREGGHPSLRRKRASCVGGPTSGSSAPTGRSSTA